MPKHSHGRLAVQVQKLREQQDATTTMPLADLLDPQWVQQVIARFGRRVRRCVLSPLQTFYAFLAQVFDADPSCEAATDRLVAWQTAAGVPACSGATGPYCKARARLPEALPRHVAQAVGQRLHDRVAPGALLRGRPIKIVDGSTASMPDTQANQQAYPQPRSQRRGVGFPIFRFVVVLCLRSGAALAAALGPYLGKQTGEQALLRTLLDQFAAGDVVLGDRYFCSYWQIALLQQRGVDCLFRMHQRRQVDFRTGRRLGPQDHVVRWTKPTQPPAWLDQARYAALPAELTVRELKYRVRVPGFRVKLLVLATTLVDAELYPAAELAKAFRARWHAELDLRSIKAALQMDVLRCKTPALVRKEFWMHLLAYNLVRQKMAEAAAGSGHLPRELSFTGALHLLRSFAPLLVLLPPDLARRLEELLLQVLARRVVGDRPDRCEPRAVKRRPKPHRLLVEPRARARRRLLRAA